MLLFVPFFTTGNCDKLFFTGPGELLGFIVKGGNLKGCTLIFRVEDEGGGGLTFVSFLIGLMERGKRGGWGGCNVRKDFLIYRSRWV